MYCSIVCTLPYHPDLIRDPLVVLAEQIQRAVLAEFPKLIPARTAVQVFRAVPSSPPSALPHVVVRGVDDPQITRFVLELLTAWHTTFLLEHSDSSLTQGSVIGRTASSTGWATGKP